MRVVPNEATNTSLIIGSDILAMAEVTINANGITIRKAMPTEFLAQINVIEEQALDIGCADPIIREKVKAIVNSYHTNKCKTTEVSMRIVTKDEKPIFHKPRRLPAPEREIVEKQVTEWLNEGIIEECTSEYASPVVVVKKKDGSPRVLIIEDLIGL